MANIRSVNRSFGREIGYVYFQDFVAGNNHDIRVTVIGDRAFAFRRAVRPGDFRASGSGILDYDISPISAEAIETAFRVARRLSAQSIAFDFLLDASSRPLICEISYCYVASAVYDCPGCWDEQLQWHEGHLWPQDVIFQGCIDRMEAGPSRAPAMAQG
jgi:ribosomal protein S6-L-glutamate ligase RimK-like protein